VSAFADINVSAFDAIAGQQGLTLSRRISRERNITLTFWADGRYPVLQCRWATQPQLARPARNGFERRVPLWPKAALPHTTTAALQFVLLTRDQSVFRGGLGAVPYLFSPRYTHYGGLKLDFTGNAMIRCECGECGKAFQVKEEYSGKRIRCPECKGIVTVPRVSESESPKRNPSSHVPEPQKTHRVNLPAPVRVPQIPRNITPNRQAGQTLITDQTRLADLEKQFAAANKRLASAESRSGRLKKTFDRIRQTGAEPISVIIRTDAKWILASSGIAGSGLGLIIGHALLGAKGAIVGIPIVGATVFVLVARFAYNATLYDLETIRKKGREAVEEVKHWTQESAKMLAVIDATRSRFEEDAIAFNQEQRQQPPKQALNRPAELRVIPVDESSLVNVPWEEKPPTDNQIRFAASLGIRLRGNESRGDVSQMIDLAIQSRNLERAQPFVVQTTVNITHQPSRGVALLFSIFWPGMGQIYQGRVFAGLFFMLFTPIGYLFLIVPGMILHLICVIDAALFTRR
jgi:hypothetical protein